MSQTIYNKFMSLPEEKRLKIMAQMGFPTEGKDYNSFLIWVRQVGKGFDLMWLIVTPLDSIDPRYVC